MFALPTFGQEAQSSDEEAPRPKPRTDDTALDEEDEEDIFGIGERNDGSIDELERTDVDDILDVSEEDVTGERPQKKRFSRTAKKFRPSNSPPSSLGGMQY
jgi:hypothetical protein